MILVNNETVLNGTITLPSTGVWIANLVLNTSDQSGFDGGSAVSIVDDNGLTFKGVVVNHRSGLFIETLHLRVAGGRNGMGNLVKTKSFRSAVFNDVIKSLLSDAGETLSPTVDTSLLSKGIGDWNITANTVTSALDYFLDIQDPNLNWRVLPDGTIWMGIETYPSVQVDFQIQAPCNPVEQMFTLGINNLSFRQGVELENVGKVSRIEYQILSSSLAAVVWVEINGGRGFIPDIQEIIRITTDRMKYFALYLGNVTSQTSDWKYVDITSVNKSIPSMSHVPLISGQYESVSGMQVLFGWFGGNPGQPFAIPLINSPSVKPIALDQDQSDCGSLTYAGPGSLTYFPPGAEPAGAIKISGIISASATKVKGS